MSTVSLDIWTGAYPSITHDITIKVYAQSAPLAVVVAATHTPPHLADTWSFPGLDRTNYVFRIFETNAGVVIQQLGADMNVVPGSAGGVKIKTTAQIESDVTVGFTSGVKVFTFDGTGGSQDWRGWDIDTIDRIGLGPMKRGVEFSWVPSTGVFTLLGGSDLFAPNEWFNVQFAPQLTEGTDSVPATIPRFSTPKIITANYNIDAGADFGGLLLIRPAGNYLELTLPDIATVVAGKMLDVEMDWSATMKCAKLKIFSGGQTIAWLTGSRPDLYVLPSENFSIYKFTDPAGPTDMWRIWKPEGNFKTVGNSVWSDALPSDVYNQILFDGSALDIFQYARLFNDHVSNLDPSQKCNFDDWATGDNKKKFSLANGSGINVNKFHIPDRRNMSDKNTDGTILPGVFQPAQVGAFNLTVTGIIMTKAGNSNQVVVMKNINDGNLGTQAVNFGTINSGLENRVAAAISRKYLLV